jgi:hypothetical protein
MNQNQRVLNHLIDHGYITQTIANNYGIRRLASRIFDLGEQGVEIEKETRFDDAGVRYVRYSLSGVERNSERNRRVLGCDYKMVKRQSLFATAA